MYKLVCFDLDGTLIENSASVWEVLHNHFGTDRELRRNLKEKALKAEISYTEWFYRDIEMFMGRNATMEGIYKAISGLRVTMGAIETLSELRRNRKRVAVISGSIDIMLKKFFPDFRFDDVYINRLEFDKNNRLIGGRPTMGDSIEKSTALKRIAKKEGLLLSECVFVGDNFNDIDAVKLAGLGISFNSNSRELDAASDIIIHKKDLREILKYVLDRRDITWGKIRQDGQRKD